MKLNVVTDDPTFVGLHLFEYLHAYLQSISDNHKSDIDINITDSTNFLSDELNVLFSSMPHNIPADLEKYDIIFVDNADESTDIFTDIMWEILNTYPNSYLIANSVTNNHQVLHRRILPIFHDWNRMLLFSVMPLYPQKFELIDDVVKEKNSIIFINGANRPSRMYFLDQLSHDIERIENYSDFVLPNKLFEKISSEADRKFLKIVNAKYNSNIGNSQKKYYDSSITLGLNGKLGKEPPGYFVIPEYIQYHCVAFPDSGWKNNELNLTEKAIKCFKHGAIPYPISGANINSLYNSIGFDTAISLLPEELYFDNIEDHSIRYKKAAEGLHWLKDNVSIFDSAAADSIRIKNKDNFYKNTEIINSIKKILNILQTAAQKKGLSL